MITRPPRRPLLWNGLRLAVGTLTILPVGQIGAITPATARAGMLLAPVAMVPLASVVGLVAALGARVGLPPLVSAGLVLAAIGLGTRAMHLDGLADTVDGLGAGWDRDRALAVMKRGDVGPMGAAALALSLIVQAGACSALVQQEWGWLLIAVTLAVSRVSCAVACLRGLPPARPGGLGAAVVGSVPAPAAAGAVIAAAAVLALAASVGGAPFWAGVPALGVGLIGAGIVLHRCTRVFGGITGDVIGAAIEVTFTLTLVTLVAAPLGLVEP